MSANKSRRLFLAGAGAFISLPFLPSALWTRRAGAATTVAPRRFMSWFVPNGMVMYNFTPTTVGTGWTLPTILASLAPVQKKIAILTGLDHEALALPQPSPTGNPPGGHGSGTGIMLNMMSVDGHATDTGRNSVDQLLLPVLNAGTPPRMSSMQIGLQGDNGLCDRADCSFSRTLSWKAGAALPNIYDPSLLFDAMFSGATSATTSMPTPASTAAASARAANQQSILDSVVAQATSLSAKLNTADKAKLEQYLTSVRDIEMQLQIQATAKPLMCTIPAKPASPGVLNFDRGITPSTVLEADMPLFVQLMGLAFTCDITRSITYMVGNGTSNNDYQFLIGSSTPHHGTSHHNGDPTKLAELTKIDTWEIQQLATLLTALDSTTDVDGNTVLDNTTFYLSSDIGDGATHNHWDMPILMAGGASGKLKLGGQHINYTDGSTGRGPALTLPRAGTATQLVGPRNPVNNTAQALLSILSAHGLPATKIGLYTGTALTEILA